MTVIPLCLSSLVGAIVAFISPIVAVWMGLALWAGSSNKHVGILILAIGFTSGALSASLIRLGFLSFTGSPTP